MPLLGHDFAEDLAGKHGAENVEIEDPAERVCGQIKEAEVGAGGGGGLVATGAVDEAVDFAELGDHSLSCLGDAVRQLSADAAPLSADAALGTVPATGGGILHGGDSGLGGRRRIAVHAAPGRPQQDCRHRRDAFARRDGGLRTREDVDRDIGARCERRLRIVGQRDRAHRAEGIQRVENIRRAPALRERNGTAAAVRVRSEARLRRGERFRAASEAPPRERRKLRHEQAAAAADEERFPIADGRIERFRRPRYREPRKHRRLLPDLRLELLSSHRPGLSPQLARTLDESRGA